MDSLMIDLFSGLGGASEPFEEAGWRVIRIDNQAHFKPTIVADARFLPLKALRPDLLWASIPCVEFARCSMPWFPDTSPSLDLAHATRAAIDYFKPHTWIVECNRFSRRYLTPLFGQVRASTTGHAFWSNRLLMLPNYCGRKEMLPPSSDRAALRAKIPRPIAQAIYSLSPMWSESNRTASASMALRCARP